MFQQLDDEARALSQPPPVPDLFKRPVTPAVAQGSFQQAPQQQEPPAFQNTQGQQPQAPPQGQGGGAGAGAAQMAQALLLYQMLQGGPMGFLQRLMPGAGQGAYRNVGNQGGAFAGLNDPSVSALFDRHSYFKPNVMAGSVRYGMDPMDFRRMYGRGYGGDNQPAVGLAPDAYQNALTFLQGILGIA
jgi:hypothetical protein